MPFVWCERFPKSRARSKRRRRGASVLKYVNPGASFPPLTSCAALSKVHVALAYFISFTTYGTRVHGDKRGSVDKFNNQFDTPFLKPDANREEEARDAMSQAPY